MIAHLDNSHVSTIEALPTTLDQNENSRVLILEVMCLTTSRCDKQSADSITTMRLTTDIADSSERQRPQQPRIRFDEYSISRNPPMFYNCISTRHKARHCSQSHPSRRTPPMFSSPGTCTSYGLRMMLF
ncbi:hypothetical protein HPB52_000181 [Rhipicephalus sanguineus]|uniref:Uncharacterized protein n=1 Tax=Rhipicephalus sanguineus TaxID=34632 RepID=A0A9D4PPR3_RHISA|nr:hypothetical protein HPB52_000181 [Rhipicephalus sanguineus]